MKTPKPANLTPEKLDRVINSLQIRGKQQKRVFKGVYENPGISPNKSHCWFICRLEELQQFEVPESANDDSIRAVK
jgi:hypothetical protein